MNSNQRSQENNQTDNMANEKEVSSSRGGTTENYSKQQSSPGTGQPGGGSKQSGTKGGGSSSKQSGTKGGGSGAGSQQSAAPYHHVQQPGEDAPEQSQGSAGMSMQSGEPEQYGGDYQYAHGRGHKSQQSMDQDPSVGSGEWQGSLGQRGASRQSSQSEGSASGAQQSVGRGPGSQQSQVGGMDWQSGEELGNQQSRTGNQGSSGSQQSQRGGGQQSQRGGGSQQSQAGAGTQQSYGAGSQQSGGAGSQQSKGASAGLGSQPSGGSHGSQASGQGGTQKYYGTGQGQHAQSSGGNEGSDKPPTRVAKEGAGMPAQSDVGRSAQTQPGEGLEGTGQSLGTDELRQESGQSRQSQQQGKGGSLSQPQGGGRMGQSSQSQGRDASSQSSDTEIRPDSSAGSAQLSGSTNSANTDSTGRVGSQTGNQQMAQGYDDVGNQRYSNDSSGGYPRSPAGKRLSAQQDMDDDTGLSNSANMQETDMGTKQVEQSNVGRRSDMTPD